MEVSNYEKVCIHFQKLFLGLEHVKIAEKLGFKYDNDNIYVTFFNRPFTLNRHNAEITRPSYNGAIPYHERLLILHHLYFCAPDAENSGNMVPFRDLRECSNFEPAYRRTTLVPLASYFDGKAELLKERAQALGGRPGSFGDVGFTVDAFPFIPLQYIFWDGDEEFPANANILFDKNIARFIHPESIPVIADAGAKLLMSGDGSTGYF